MKINLVKSLFILSKRCALSGLLGSTVMSAAATDLPEGGNISGVYDLTTSYTGGTEYAVSQLIAVSTTVIQSADSHVSVTLGGASTSEELPVRPLVTRDRKSVA